MNNANISDIWESLLNYVESCTEDPGYARWVKEDMPQSITGNVFEIVVEKQFIKDWIDNKYKTNMEKILSSLCGREMKLLITNLNTKDEEDRNNIMDRPVAPIISAVERPISNILQTKNTLQDNLIGKYVFENFVIGNSNRFAHAAALAVAESPAKVYNPLFLYSDAGLGKTHLMHAIGNRIKQNHPEMKILYISSETFTNEMINCIQKNAMENFRNKYRNIDVLLIDDIQFLRKKESTQEEFFHTFNALRDANKQIIISSDRKPSELDTLEERLRSRFSWGLSTDIQSPDLETRMAILRNMAASDNIELPNDVVLLMASAIETNIRELEGAYTKVIAYTNFSNSPITLENAQKALTEFNIGNVNKIISIQEIQQLVSTTFKIKMDDFLAKKRTRNVAFPRQIAMYLCRELTDYSLPRIGDFFGGRDHTTVIHACEKISKDMKKDPNLEKTIKEIIVHLKK
jgi:chromosomal replication initiator protein